jgi:hypothetical protein
MPYNGLPRYGYLPDGYKGNFSIKRVGSQLDLLQIQLIQLFNRGGLVNAGYINKQTVNTDGSITRFQYIRAVFWMDSVSSGSRDKEISQSVEWMASDCVVIG